MTFTDTEITRAYAATKSLGSPIGRTDTDARKLTLDQIKAIGHWCDAQTCSTFEDKHGNQFPLQAVLDLWHASIVWESFEAWFEDDPKAAKRAYVAICKKHGIKHGA